MLYVSQSNRTRSTAVFFIKWEMAAFCRWQNRPACPRVAHKSDGVSFEQVQQHHCQFLANLGCGRHHSSVVENVLQEALQDRISRSARKSRGCWLWKNLGNGMALPRAVCGVFSAMQARKKSLDSSMLGFHSTFLKSGAKNLIHRANASLASALSFHRWESKGNMRPGNESMLTLADRRTSFGSEPSSSWSK